MFQKRELVIRTKCRHADKLHIFIVYPFDELIGIHFIASDRAYPKAVGSREYLQ